MKTNFKRILTLYLVFLATFFWQGCGQPAETTNADQPGDTDIVTENVTPEPEPTPEVIDEPTENTKKEETKPEPGILKPSKAERNYKMPSFPFPPPKASASHTFEENVFAQAESLYEVSELIERALKKSGYFEKSYYEIPNGFALVTRMEKMKADGSPADEGERWNINPENSRTSFSLMSYFKSLFIAEDGNYRIIVFLISSENLRQSEKTMTMKEAKEYLTKGFNRLPNYFKNIPFTQDYSCSALIYEWYKIEHESPKFMQPSKFLGQYHLAKNKFVEYIGEE